jgi:bacterial translation initiation factor 2 (bIF-2)
LTFLNSKKPKKKTDARGKRKRISKPDGRKRPGAAGNNKPSNKRGRKNVIKEEPTDEEIQKQVRETLEKLQGKSNKSKAARYRRDKRDQHREKAEAEQAQSEEKILKVTEFVTVNDISTHDGCPCERDYSVPCMSLGMMVTMNQRLTQRP